MLELIFTILIGSWESNCIQTQNQNHQGYLKEIYQFEKENQRFINQKYWYSDDQCSLQFDSETQVGTFKLGNKITPFFSGPENFELDFYYDQNFDLGVVSSLSKESIKIGRGMINSNWRNTMPSLFELKKIK
jgi:hypothetical protein